MRYSLFGRYAGPFVALGGVLALACLASTWYINRLQSDLARAVRRDVARMQAAEELQIRLRSLRLHSLVDAASHTERRQQVVEEDRNFVSIALAEARREIESHPEDRELLAKIEQSYREYESALIADKLPEKKLLTAADLIRWSDAHPITPLLAPCRELADRQHEQMDRSIGRSETQTTLAGRVLLGLGFAGALGGLLAGYATARGLSNRAARLSVRVRAVQAQLDQDVGEMTLDSLPLADVDSQLDRVIGRVKEVCQRLQDQERDLLRAEQLAAVGHLAAGVAHEIRNPLTGIKFLVEAALRPNQPSPLEAEDLRLIRQEILRMERTIQGLLDYARTPPLNRKQHDVRRVVNEACNIARGRAEAKAVSLHVDAPDGTLSAEVDRDQVLSLFTNLIYNAIEATPRGGAVSVSAVEADGAIQIEVSDEGAGIDPAVAGKLGEPFVTTKPTGTGLGLTIARRIARDHGGTLTAGNRPDGGASFRVSIPIRGKA